MKRELTQAAQVAKLCKQYCKSRGIPCRVKSDNYSMGNSVDVYVTDQPPEIMDELNKEFAKYKYGRFDGMTDMYEYTNRRDDIPQTKYLNVNNEYSDSLKQKALTFLKARMAGYDAVPGDIAKLTYNDRNVQSGEYVFSEIYRLLGGKFYGELYGEFVAEQAKAAA